uniref:Uncharacterized protein n=1 Tax=Arundo donax TaxID=35708 RepID=A0A0A9AKA5_ARUDO
MSRVSRWSHRSGGRACCWDAVAWGQPGTWAHSKRQPALFPALPPPLLRVRAPILPTVFTCVVDRYKLVSPTVLQSILE